MRARVFSVLLLAAGCGIKAAPRPPLAEIASAEPAPAPEAETPQAGLAAMSAADAGCASPDLP